MNAGEGVLLSVRELYREYAGKEPDAMEEMPASGSARRYFRVTTGEKSLVATCNEDTKENAVFIDLSRHFRKKGLHVPEVYAVSPDARVYLQEDLGSMTLLDAVEYDGKMLTEKSMNLYRRALEELWRFQLMGHEGLDYGKCLLRRDFDRQGARWDLDYYKYCFLRLSGVPFDEGLLEEDFERLSTRIGSERRAGFMYRDFQSRNIMVKDETLHFVDFQGGRRGALPYDVASLLFDAAVSIPEEQREELLEFYLSRVAHFHRIGARRFRTVFDHFALVRLLQAMGAFGLRGLYEGKSHFANSIVPGLHLIVSLFTPDRLDAVYPEIERGVRAALLQYEGIEK